MKQKNMFIKLFWWLQISGWSLLYVIYLGIYLRTTNVDFNLVVGLFFSQLSGFSVSLLLREIYKKIHAHGKSIFFIAIAIFISSLFFANIWFWFDILISLTIRSYQSLMSHVTLNYYLTKIWSNTFTFITWSTLYFGMKFWFDFKNQEKHASDAIELAQKAQLQMLRYQLNPHFLFNSLNSIRALVEEDKKKAKEMITELSEFLRYSLTNKNNSKVPLSSELEVIKHYLAIEKKRFENKLDIIFDNEPNSESYPVLSFLIHPLVENAIKYGMQTSSLPLKVNIKTEIEDKSLKVTVRNTGKWISSTVEKDNNFEGTGTGIENVKKRLENAFPENNFFNIIEKDGWVNVILEIKDINKN